MLGGNNKGEVNHIRRIVLACERDMEDFTAAMDAVNVDLDEMRATRRGLRCFGEMMQTFRNHHKGILQRNIERIEMRTMRTMMMISITSMRLMITAEARVDATHSIITSRQRVEVWLSDVGKPWAGHHDSGDFHHALGHRRYPGSYLLNY